MDNSSSRDASQLGVGSYLNQTFKNIVRKMITKILWVIKDLISLIILLFLIQCNGDFSIVNEGYFIW